MSKPDGGRAFPVIESGEVSDYGHDGQHWMSFNTADGMSLRDYFAGQALHVIAAGMFHFKQFRDEPAEMMPRLIADGAYALADAMLAERSKE